MSSVTLFQREASCVVCLSVFEQVWSEPQVGEGSRGTSQVSFKVSPEQIAGKLARVRIRSEKLLSVQVKQTTVLAAVNVKQHSLQRFNCYLKF